MQMGDFQKNEFAKSYERIFDELRKDFLKTLVIDVVKGVLIWVTAFIIGFLVLTAIR